MTFTCRWRFRSAFLAAIAAAALAAGPTAAEIRRADLNHIRSVSEGDWLRLKLAVLGLRLSYPAYRIDLDLSDDSVIAFNFWISAPLAQHLEDSGRGEMERVLTYHARGIRDQVLVLLRDEFPELWPIFDVSRDLAGVFLVPGEDFDSLPRDLAHWRDEDLILQ